MEAKLYESAIEVEGLPLSYSFTVGEPNEKGGKTVLHASIEMRVGEALGTIWFTPSHHALKERVSYCSAAATRRLYGLIFQALSQNTKPTLRLATWRLLSLIPGAITSNEEAAEFANWMQALVAIPEHKLYRRLDQAARSTEGISHLSWRELIDLLIGGVSG